MRELVIAIVLVGLFGYLFLICPTASSQQTAATGIVVIGKTISVAQNHGYNDTNLSPETSRVPCLPFTVFKIVDENDPFKTLGQIPVVGDDLSDKVTCNWSSDAVFSHLSPNTYLSKAGPAGKVSDITDVKNSQAGYFYFGYDANANQGLDDGLYVMMTYSFLRVVDEAGSLYNRGDTYTQEWEKMQNYWLPVDGFPGIGDSTQKGWIPEGMYSGTMDAGKPALAGLTLIKIEGSGSKVTYGFANVKDFIFDYTKTVNSITFVPATIKNQKIGLTPDKNALAKVVEIPLAIGVEKNNEGLFSRVVGFSWDVVVAAANTPLSLLMKAVEWALNFVFDMIKTGIQLFISAINWLLNMQKDQVLSLGIASAWAKVRDVSISILVLVLVIIAFANALQFDIEKYGLNRMIPKIIIAIVLSYLSWAIVAFLFDFTTVLQNTAMTITNSSGGNLFQNGLSTGDIATLSLGTLASGGAGGIMLLVLLIYSILFISITILLFLLTVRVFMLSFLLAIAPLAFMMMILPFTESYYKAWWKHFIKWLFMGPFVVLILSIGLLIAGSGNGAVKLNELGQTTIRSSGGSFIVKFVILCATFVFAAFLPLKMGGKLMQGWAKVGKTAASIGKYSPGRTYNKGREFIRAHQASIKLQDTRAARGLQSRIAQKGRAGRFAAGVARGDVAAHREKLVGEAYSEIKDLSYKDMANELTSTKDIYKKQAIERRLDEEGRLGMVYADRSSPYYDQVNGGYLDKAQFTNPTDQANIDALNLDTDIKAARHVASRLGQDQQLEDSFLKKNGHAAYMAGHNATPGSAEWTLYRKAISKQAGREGKEVSYKYIKALQDSGDWAQLAKHASQVENAMKFGNAKLQGNWRAIHTALNGMSPAQITALGLNDLKTKLDTYA